jgi:hypothetical protein
METITIPFDLTGFADELMQNLPEYSLSLRCTKWDYENSEFSFHDPDTRINHMIGKDKIVPAVKKYIEDSLILQMRKGFIDPAFYFDAGNYDAPMVDMIVQIAIFGKEIYG